MSLTQANIIVGLGTGFLTVGTYGQSEGASTDLGATEGGATISVDREYFEKRSDQSLGDLELIKTVETATLKVVLAEATLDNLRIAMDYPSGALASSVLNVGGNATVTELTIYLNVVAPSGGTRKYVFHKAVCISASEHAYKKDDKTMIDCEFRILQDTSQSDNQQLFSATDTGSDTTAPTIVLTTPADGGTVTKDTKGTVLWTITESNPMNEQSIKYGDDDDATFMILNTTTPASTALVAGSIVYDSTAKTVTFTPDSNWTASDTLQAIVTTGLKDVAGNRLASIKIEQFSVTA